MKTPTISEFAQLVARELPVGHAVTLSHTLVREILAANRPSEAAEAASILTGKGPLPDPADLLKKAFRDEHGIEVDVDYRGDWRVRR